MSETNLSAAPEQSTPAAAPEAAAPHEATEETVTVGALRGPSNAGMRSGRAARPKKPPCAGRAKRTN